MGIDLLPLFLFALFLIGIKPVKGKGNINEHYLSLYTGSNLRGLFALVIVFHHIALYTDLGFLFRLFTHIGRLSVAVFFFLSGYGLQKSYMGSEKYKYHFLQRRLPKILIPYVGVTILFWILHALHGNIYSIGQIIGAVLRGAPIVSFSWYIIAICHFYFAYWLFMLICKNNYNLMIIFACLWYVVYCIVCRKLEYDAYWYDSAYLLIFGMVYAIYEHKLVQKIKVHYSIITPTAIIGFFFTMYRLRFVNSESSRMILTMLSAVLFVLSIVLIIMKIKIGNSILDYFGKISLEIYLVQGLFIAGLRSNIIYIANDLTWAVMVTLGSILLAAILHKIFAAVTKRCLPI